MNSLHETAALGDQQVGVDRGEPRARARPMSEFGDELYQVLGQLVERAIKRKTRILGCNQKIANRRPLGVVATLRQEDLD